MVIYSIAGLATLGCILLQAISFASEGKLEIVNFLSLFTIQSNVLAGTVFVLMSKINGKVINYFRGLAVHSLLITSLGYIFLLGNKQDYLLPSVNIVVHYLVPAFALLSWIFHQPNSVISLKGAIGWLLFPFLYFIYSMTRGFLTSWYPYDFIDPNKVSTMELTRTFYMLLIGSLLLSWILMQLASRFFRLKLRLI